MEYEQSMTLVQKVLRQVNIIRTASGFSPLKRLRKGKKGDACHCPIANSLYEIYASCGSEPHVNGGHDILIPERYTSPVKAVEEEAQNEGVFVSGDSEWNRDVRVGSDDFDTFIGAFDHGELPKLDEQYAGPEELPPVEVVSS